MNSMRLKPKMIRGGVGGGEEGGEGVFGEVCCSTGCVRRGAWLTIWSTSAAITGAIFQIKSVAIITRDNDVVMGELR